MNRQKLILEKYREVFGKQTLKTISETTGIQMTRVFRLLNGSEMKITEYECFLNVLQNYTGLPLWEEEAILEFSKEFLLEVRQLIVYKKRTLEILKGRFNHG